MEILANPSRSQLEESDIDIMVGASYDSVSMVEGEFDEISEEEMTNAIKFGHEASKVQIEAQNDLVNEIGKKDTREYDHSIENKDLLERCIIILMKNVMKLQRKDSKKQRSEKFSNVKEDLLESFDEEELEEMKVLF